MPRDATDLATVTDHLEITGADGECRRVEVAGDRLLIDGCDMQLVRVRGGVRIEPCKPGATFVVDGEDLFCKDLRPGEAAVVAGCQLRWLSDAANPAVAPSRPPASGRTAGRDRRSSTRPRPRSNWLPVVAITAVLLLVAIFVVKRLGNSTWPHSPQHFVDLARAQLGNLDPNRALETLAFALGEADGDTRQQALALEAEIRKMLLEVAAGTKVVLAQQQHDLLRSFVTTYLQVTERPAARECVRLCDRWLERHRELCTWHDDGKPLLATIEGTRARYVAVAELSSAESAADVIFAARSRLRFRWRDYRQAIARIDAFLAQNPDDAQVVAERQRLLADAEPWLLQRLRQVERLLARGDTGNAEIDLDRLDRWSIIPAWRSRVEPLRQRLDGMR